MEGTQAGVILAPPVQGEILGGHLHQIRAFLDGANRLCRDRTPTHGPS